MGPAVIYEAKYRVVSCDQQSIVGGADHFLSWIALTRFLNSFQITKKINIKKENVKKKKKATISFL